MTISVTCPVCGESDWVQAREVYSLPEHRWFDAWQCGRCGLRSCHHWILHPPDYADDYYSRTSTPHTSARLWLKVVLECAPGVAAGRLASRLLTVKVPPAPQFGARLLDVGCGNGELLARATLLGWRAEGCEIDDVAALEARARGYVCHTGEWWRELEPGTFDLIVMSHVLEHLPDPGLTLAAVSQALRQPEGRLVVGMPNFSSAYSMEFGPTSWLCMPPEHLWYLEPRHLSRLLEQAGLVVLETHTQPVFLEALSPRRLRAQRRVSRGAGESRAFLARYVRATVRGLLAGRETPPPWAAIYSYVCRGERL